MLRVLIADDSPTARQLLAYLVNCAEDMQVIAEASNGREAVRLAARLNPDIVLMDIIMPQMDGLEATVEIMHTCPLPIVLVSASHKPCETEKAFQAMRLGALTVLPKPSGVSTTQPEAVNLLNTLRAMANVKVIHHWPRPVQPAAAAVQPLQNVSPEIIAIVSSTGGPAALNEILRQLPADFPLPIVIVQHITMDFLPSLASWISHSSKLSIRIAETGESPQKGIVYFAPSGQHIEMDLGRRFVLSQDRQQSYVPSGDIFLHSVARAYRRSAIGIVLTGMGADGAQGLKAMRDAGAVTVAQDKETSVVFGMPQVAIEMNAAQEVLSLSNIARLLNKYGGMRS